jgi:hypothetical protein
LHITAIRVTVNVPAGGVLRGVTIDGELATQSSGNPNFYTGSILTDAPDSVTFAEIIANYITAGHIQPDYSAPGGTTTADLIASIRAPYIEFTDPTAGNVLVSGYQVTVEVPITAAFNVDDIVITDDATNAKLASLKEGGVTKSEFNKYQTTSYLSAGVTAGGKVAVSVYPIDGAPAHDNSVNWGDES